MHIPIWPLLINLIYFQKNIRSLSFEIWTLKLQMTDKQKLQTWNRDDFPTLSLIHFSKPIVGCPGCAGPCDGRPARAWRTLERGLLLGDAKHDAAQETRNLFSFVLLPSLLCEGGSPPGKEDGTGERGRDQ